MPQIDFRTQPDKRKKCIASDNMNTVKSHGQNKTESETVAV